MENTIEQIRDEMAVEHGWESRHQIDEAYKNNSISQYSFDDYLEDVAKVYAQQCCEAQRIACAENAKITLNPNSETWGQGRPVILAMVDKQSILDTPLVV